MLIDDLNIYSLIVPIIMAGLGISILIFHHSIRHLPNYLFTYALALICIGLSIFLHTALQPDILIQYMTVVICIFFISCVLNIHAFHQRLKIQTLWSRLIVIVSIACAFIFYFSIVNYQQSSRLMVIGITTTLIFTHNYKALFNLQIDSRLDLWLRNLLWIIATIALFRALALTYFTQIEQLISMSALIWASTQFMLITIDLVVLMIFMGCATQEIMFTLRQERDLDPLTGLLNRRGLEQQLMRLPKHPSTSNAILLCDLDYFKQVNDLYGHHTGDLALQHVSQIISKAIRRYDNIARIGGEEFLIILQDVDVDTAICIAERIRSDIQNTVLVYRSDRIQLTASIGVAYFSTRNEFKEASRLADQLLYQAKNLGRNNVQRPSQLHI